MKRKKTPASILFPFILTALAMLPGQVKSATWDNGGSAGLFSDLLNWSGNTLPVLNDDLVFTNPGLPSTIHFDGVRPSFNSLTFNGGGTITLGAAGTSFSLGVASATVPNITVSAGTTAIVNAPITGNINLSGGGTLQMDNFFALNGNITVDGAGTTLRVVSRAPFAHAIGGVGGARNEYHTIGPITTATETVTLSNGGVLLMAGTGLNPDGSTKNLVLGTGGGVIHVSNGLFNIDDGAQISGAGLLTKRGTGRLVITSQAYGLTGGSKTEAGFLEVGNAGTFASTATHVVDGGVFALALGTTAANFVHAGMTLNNGGAIGAASADHAIGSNTVASTLTLNGGYLLAADYTSGTGARLMRINSYLKGSGTVEIVGGSGGNHRIVLQRGDATESTFDGRFVLNDFTGIENNPGNASGTGTGNALGSATVEYKGINSFLDLRDNGTGSNGTLANYSGVDLDFVGTAKGSIYALRISNSTANTGNVYSLGTLTIGDQFLSVTTANNYRASFSNVVLTGSPIIATTTTGNALGILTFSTAINEDAAGRSLTKIGANTSSADTSQINTTSSINVTNLNLVQGTLSLQGANGKIGLGAVSGTGTLTISTQGVLRLDDSGTVASGQRLHANLSVVMRGGTISLQSNTASATNSHQVIENLNVAGGYVTFEAVRNNAGALSVLQLGSATTWTRANNTIVNFVGTNLGTAGNTSRILINGQTTTGFMGGWAISGAEFAKYDTTESNGFGLGVTALVAGDYTINPTEAGLLTGLNVKMTGTSTVTLLGNRQVNSLNFQHASALAASTDSLVIGAANLLRIESGGILVSGQAAFIDHFAAAGSKGQLTAGAVADQAATLWITNETQLDIGARIVNNGTGALTVVKAGAGTLRLTNTNAAATNNTFSGGLVINSGRVDAFGQFSLPSDVTLAGGHLEMNTNNASASFTTGRNITVTGNGSTLGMDNNGPTGTPSQTNQSVTFGTLTFNAPYSGEGAPTLNFGGFDSIDAIFTSMTLANGVTLNVLNRDANSFLRINGVVAGSGGLTITGNAGGEVVYFGNNDTTHNTYTGDVILKGGRLVLNKANNITAITGNVIINGGGLYWGGTGRGNQLSANSKVYLYSGTLGQSDEGTANGATNDYDAVIPELIMSGGTFNSGRNTFTVQKATISGGTIEVQGTNQLGATLTLNNTDLLHGANNIGVKGDASSDLTVLVLGGSYFKTVGQNIVLASATTTFSAGSELQLGTDVTVATNPFAANSLSSGISIATGRELQLVNRVDLQGGIRAFDIASDAFFTIQPNIVNGGLIKNGLGTLVLSSYLNSSTYNGSVTVNAGTLMVRNDSSLGTAVGGTTVANGATIEMDAGLKTAESFTLSGHGAVDKTGALVVTRGKVTLSGDVTLAGDTSISTYATGVTPDAAYPNATGPTLYSLSQLIMSGAVGGNGTLRLRGEGYGVISGGITTSGGLVKDGSGEWKISGGNTYTGMTDITAGVLRTGSTLGSTAAGTRVLGGASLVMENGANIGAEALELHGIGATSQRGVLVSTGGSNAGSGGVVLVTDAQNPNVSIYVADGSLTLSGAVSTTTQANLIILADGNLSLTGDVNLGTSSITKNGTGLLTLSGGAKTYSTIQVNAGGLQIDSLTTQIQAGSALNLSGGDLSLTGDGVVTFDTWRVLAGGAEVDLGAAIVSVSNFTRSLGATVNFTDPAVGFFPAFNNNGILGGWATVGGDNWAAYDGMEVTALSASAYTTLYEDSGSTSGSGSPTQITPIDNVLINKTQQNVSSIPLTANSLKIAGAGKGLGQGAFDLTLSSGGVLYVGTPGSVFGIEGAANLTQGGGELVFHVKDGTLDIGMTIAGSAGITKDGSGTLFLNAGNAFTGDIFVNEGFIAIAGTGTADPTALGVAGARTVRLNGGGFSLIAGSYDPAAATKAFEIGADGGTLHVGGGDSTQLGLSLGTLTLGDAGQLLGTGTLTKTGNGRLTLGAQNFAFTGDVVVKEGILTTQGDGSMGGRLAYQKVTVEKGAMLQLGATTFDGTLVLKDGSHLMGRGNTTHIMNGQILADGNVSLYLINGENFGQGENFQVENKLTLTAGSVLNVYGRSNGNTLNLTSANDIAGTIKMNANTTLQVFVAGGLGNAVNRATVELNGVNSRLFLHENATADFNFNLAVNADSFLDMRPAGGSANNFFSINNLTIANGKWFNLSGASNEQLHVAGITTFAGDAMLNLGLNTVLRTVSGGSNISKLGASTLYLTDVVGWNGKYVQYAGNTQLLQNATMSGLSSLVIKGGRLTIDNTQGMVSNRLADSLAITMFGGEFFSSGTETVGTLSVKGSVGIRQSFATSTLGSIGTAPHVLTFSGTIAGSREVGGTIDFRAESGSTMGGAGVTPRIVFTGQGASTFLGGAYVNGNDWVQYSATVDSTAVRGVGVMNTYTSNPANDGSLTAATHLNLTSVNLALTANRSINTLRVDGSRSITQGAFNLAIASGGVINTTTAGTLTLGANTTDAGTVTANGDGITGAELFFHVLGGTVIANSRIVDNGAGAVAVVKSQAGTLQLNNDGNTFTGGLFINQGTVAATNVTTALGAAGRDIFMQGGTLALRHENGGASNGVIGYDQNITVRANSTLSLDRVTGSNSVAGNVIRFGRLTLDDAALLIRNNFNTGTAASNYNLLFNGGAVISGNAIVDNARNGTTGNQPDVVILGAVSGTGKLYKNNAGLLAFGSADLLDASANTWNGDLIINGGDVLLRKTAGTAAVNGNIYLNGGNLSVFTSNQISDSSNIEVNTGTLDFRGVSESVNSVIVNGGFLRTASTGSGGVVSILGDLTVTGGANTNTIMADNLTTLRVGGTLRLSGTGRVETGATGILDLNNVEMTGTTIRVSSGAGASNLVLRGGVTTLASEFSAVINGDNDSDSWLNLTNGTTSATPTFNVADGTAVNDLIVTVRMRNGMSGTAVGGFIKDGAGAMVLAGTAANDFTGNVHVKAGRLDLAKTAGVASIFGNAGAPNTMTIDAGATVRQLNADQISNTVSLVVNGTYDLEYGNASETVARVTGTNSDAQILVGPGSTLTTDFTNAAGVATYAGHIYGTGASTGATTAGAVVKNGTGVWELTGVSEFAGNAVVNGGELSVSGKMTGNTAYLKTGTVLSGRGTVGNVVLESNAQLRPGAANDSAGTTFGTLTIEGDFNPLSGSNTLLQIRSATTTTNFGGFAVGTTDYQNFITNQANSNAAWDSTITGEMDHIVVTGTLGNNGDITLVSGSRFTITTAGGYSGGYGDVFKLLDWTGVMTSTGFVTNTSGTLRQAGLEGDLQLPALSAGLFYDVSLFTSHGILIVVPEPGRAALLIGALALVLLRRRRRLAI